jgi:hypothetical protein
LVTRRAAWFISCIIICSIFCSITLILLSAITRSSITNIAFADGLTQEQISASLGNRQSNLLIKMNPSVVTTETLQTKPEKPIIEFRLFDSGTNKSFNHVNYDISILDKDNKQLFSNWFHSHYGMLGIEIVPNNSTHGVKIEGEQEPLIGSYIGTLVNPVIAEGPIFLKGGLYHFKVRIGTIDCDTCVLPADQQHVYDSWLSIGSTLNRQINMEGKQVPIKVISYYDKLNGFNFNEKDKQMQFSMPFDWNIDRLKKASIFVHEEIYVPKSNAFTNTSSYSGTVNGLDVTKDIMLDNTDPNVDIIHIMLTKNSLLNLAERLNTNTNSNSNTNNGQEEFPQPQQQLASQQQAFNGLMKFAVQPSAVKAGTNMSTAMGSMGSM